MGHALEAADLALGQDAFDAAEKLADLAEGAANKTRQVSVSSSCGLCGRQTIESLMTGVTVPATSWTIAPATLVAIPAALRTRQTAFDATGQNALASTYLIQLKGKAYQLVWPQLVASVALEWPMKGWKQ